VHAHVDPDTEAVEIDPIEPSPSKEDCKHVAELMKQGGVNDAESARAAFQELTGRDITSTSELTMVEAEQLLSAPELVVSRTQQALAVKHE
jgi:hypothetical protein